MRLQLKCLFIIDYLVMLCWLMDDENVYYNIVQNPNILSYIMDAGRVEGATSVCGQNGLMERTSSSASPQHLLEMMEPRQRCNLDLHRLVETSCRKGGASSKTFVVLKPSTDCSNGLELSGSITLNVDREQDLNSHHLLQTDLFLLFLLQTQNTGLEKDCSSSMVSFRFFIFHHIKEDKLNLHLRTL